MKRILIADDSSFMRKVLTNILIRNGYTVVGEASNGMMAFEMYKDMAPNIVTMDITMEKMTGLEALKNIMEYDKKANVVMVSAMGQEAFIKEAAKLGAKGFLIKPFKEASVLATLACLE